MIEDASQVAWTASGNSANGLPGMSSPSGTVTADPTHVVFTRDVTGTTKFYVNGEDKGLGDFGGNLSNWDAGFRLVLPRKPPKTGLGTALFISSRFTTAYSRRTKSELAAPG